MKLGGKERSLALTHVFQLDFDSFDLEESDTCLYDSLTILADVEGAEEIGRRNPPAPDFFCALMCALGIKVGICVVVVFVAVMCGGSVPPPVLSYHSLMVLHFVSDSSVARRGFHATVAFISHAGAWATCVKDPHTRSRNCVANLCVHVCVFTQTSYRNTFQNSRSVLFGKPTRHKNAENTLIYK